MKRSGFPTFGERLKIKMAVLSLTQSKKCMLSVFIIQFFRKISLDVDYTTPELNLPEYNISSIEDEIPEGMDDRIVTIETLYADHGIELIVNRAHCSKVTLPWSSNLINIMMCQACLVKACYNCPF